MILYNVTVNIDYEIEENWKRWMIDEHIPKVMGTGFFSENKFFKLLNEVPEAQGATYSIQYFAENMTALRKYERNHADQLRKEHDERYANRFVVFRTYLESVDSN
jgi:hypothetical protein